MTDGPVSGQPVNYMQAVSEFAFTVTGAVDRIKPSAYLDDRYLRKARRFAIRRPLSIYAVLFITGIVLVGIINLIFGGYGLQITATTYLAAPAILIGGYQAWLTSLIKQADQMQNYLATLFEQERFKVWFSHFYSFQNDDFDRIDALQDSAAMNELLSSLNATRQPESCLWHPKLLAGTSKEAEIDAFLGHLNVLGDYYERGMLSLDEIGDVAEYYLFGVGNCRAFQAYIWLIREAFRGETEELKPAPGEQTRFRVKFGYPPFRHLCLLLHDLDARRRHKELEIYDLFNQICVVKIEEERPR
jgi:hypothetical protein